MMTFIESSVNSYTLKFRPPQPTVLWKLPESALEDLCLPEDDNNAMFIAEPPTYNRPRTMEKRNGFVTGPYHDAQSFCHEDPEIINIPDSLTQPLLFDNNEIQRNPTRNNKPPHAKTHNKISSPSIYPSGVVNDIPYRLLVQMGLAKPCEEPGVIENCRKQLGNDNVAVVEGRGQVSKSNGNVKIAEAMKRFSKASELYAERILRPCESDERLKVCPATKNTNQKKFSVSDSQSRRFLERHSSLSQLFLSEELVDGNIDQPSNLVSAKCTKDQIRELGVSKTTNEIMKCKKVGDDRIEEDSKSGVGIFENKKQIHREKLEKACNTSQAMEGNKNLESQSSLSQLFQSQEFDVTHYRDIMSSYGVSLSTDGKSKDSATSPVNYEGDVVQNDHDNREKLPSDNSRGSEELIVNTDRNVQPFIIRGCEPKMFDTSVKRKEDNPWKSEVRQGVLEPTEQVSNRDKREMEEIPMVVSPYFPNENNYPVQDEKRTSLYNSSASHDSQTISLSQDNSSKGIFHKIFEHEATEELKLCEDFFKHQSSNSTMGSGTKNSKTSKKYKKIECRKITSYFPVIKNLKPEHQIGSQPIDCMRNKKTSENSDDEHERVQNKCEVNRVSPGQAKFISSFHNMVEDKGNPNKRKNYDLKLKEPKYNVSKSSRKRNRYESECPEDGTSVPYGSRKFDDLGAGCVKYQLPSKHVFLDLPPGSVQSMSQLKPVGFDRKKSGTTEGVVSSESSKSVEMPSSQEKIIDFRRVAVENADYKREIRVLEEEKVEEIALEMESSGDLFEIGFTLCYKEKYSVLNRPEGCERKLHHPAGVMSRVEFSGGKTIRIYQSLNELAKENSRSFLLCLLESNCRKLCFEAQAFMMFVLEVLIENDDRTCHDWLLLDPIIGMWLLNPDYPPHSFNCVMKEFNIKVDSCTNHLSPEWKDTVSDYMDAQSKVIEKLHAELSKWNLWDVFYRMETPLTPILACMEKRSIEVNYGQLKDISKVLQEKLNSLQQSAWTLLGKKFQLTSPLQLRTILYEELKLDEIGEVKVKCTANSGAKSTDEGTLKLLLGVHPLPALILEYRHAHKIKSTYIDGIMVHVVNKTSVSTTWEQCAAATGRITSSTPNLQSIPKQEENLIIGGECFNVRKIFVSRFEHAFVAVDFQQIELRMFAQLSQDESLISAFKEPGDIFRTMTKIRIGKGDFEPSEREKTKTLMYALLYGAGPHKISELLSVDMEHAIRICSDFYASFPGLKSFRARVLQECRARKQLRSLSGRRRLFPNITSSVVQQKRHTERQAVNFVIQGSAADICKAAMLRTEAALRGHNLQANLLLQIHDELLWEVPEEHAPRATEIIKGAIEETKDYWSSKFNLKINLPVKITSGKSWGSMKCETEQPT